MALIELHNSKLYKEYRQRLDVQAVLDHYRAENQHEVANSDGTTEIVHSCLLDRIEPHHKNGDQNPSACANIDKKVYVCYSYWGGDIFHLIMKMEGKDSLASIIPILSGLLGDSNLEPDTFAAELERLLAEPGFFSTTELPAYSDRILVPWATHHPYLTSRGISVDASSKLRVGYDPSDNRIVFPHFWQDKLVGWQKRSIPRNPGHWPGTLPDMRGGTPKYLNTTGFPKSETLYGFDEARKSSSVIVVESPFSVLKAVSLGLDTPVVATFGAKVSQNQLELLRDFDEIIVWMDDDLAGIGAERKLVKGLFRYTHVSVVLPEEGKDLADYATREEVEQMLSTRRVPAAFRIAAYELEKEDSKKHGRRGYD